MTKSEWRIVKILLVLVLLAALLPASAFAYRFLFQRDLTLESLGQLGGGLLPAPADTPLPAADDTATNTDANNLKLSEFVVSDQGFAISIPGTWQRLPMNPRDLNTLLDGMRSENPEVANALGANSQALITSGIRFWAFDADPTLLKQNLMTTLSVLKRSLPGPTSLDTYVQVNVNQLSSLKTRVGAISQEVLTLSNVPAVKLRYTLSFTRGDGSTTLSAQTQYLLINNADAYVIGFTTIPEQNEHYAPIFEKCANSFRILY